MNELIKINLNENQEPIISGRELYEKLGIKTPYTQWMDRMIEYGFTKNVDFSLHSQKCESSNISGFKVLQDHFISIDMAKEICMIQRNEIGKTFRKYFIQVEKDYNSPEKIMARALLISQKQLETLKLTNKELEDTIEKNKPKVIFAEALAVSDKSILIGELAKILKQNGIEIGQNRLFEELRQQGYLMSKGESYNQPTQKAMDLKLFEIKKNTINNANGSVRVTTTTKVTPKGQEYFINRYLKERG